MCQLRSITVRSRALVAPLAALRPCQASTASRLQPPAAALSPARLHSLAAPSSNSSSSSSARGAARWTGVCRDSNSPGSDSSGPDSSGLALNAGLLGLWAALLGYVFVLAPNQTPSIDAFVVQKLVGLKADDPFQVNEVFTAVWNFMGLYPAIYAALLIPAARSNKLPAWPFCVASVFLGAYALIPFMCLWAPKSPPQELPPPPAELEGWSKGFMRAAETPWLPAGLLAAGAYWFVRAATAGGDAWLQYVQLFDESRLVHATSIDFSLLTLLMPFWMANDAQGRDWGNRSVLVPLLCLLPVVGPATYLLLRPKTYGLVAGEQQQ